MATLPDIPILAACEHRRLYRIGSRNLRYGVYNARTHGFIGIRCKFGDFFLFQEYHKEVSRFIGTVNRGVALPELLPGNIRLIEYRPAICETCRQRVRFVNSEKAKREGRTQGRWRHRSKSVCPDAFPVREDNSELFDWLEIMEKKYDALLAKEPNTYAPIPEASSKDSF